MITQLFKFLVLGGMLIASADQVALGQFRGFDRGGDRDDGDRDEMRRRWEEMRSRYGGGDRDSGDRDEMRRRFEEMRSRGGFSGGGFRGFDRNDDDRDRSRGDEDRSRYDRSRSGGDSRSSGRDSGRPTPYVPAPHTPIAVALPGNYASGDSDADGQITLLEWRQWKPQEIAQFMMMDTNKDGFLTARELIIAENFSSEMASATPANTYSANPQPTPTPTPTGSSRDAEGNPTSSGEKASAPEARYVFSQLDRSADGQLTAEEWERSKSVREGFARAGVTLKLPTDLNGFLAQYPAYRVVPQLRLPND